MTIGRPRGRLLSRSRLAVLGALAVSALLVPGCTSGRTASPGVPGAAASASPSAPTSAPSPSVDVASAFVARLSRPDFSARAEVTGDVRIGTLDGEVRGEMSLSGPDYTSTLVFSLAGVEEAREEIAFRGQRFLKEGDGPWIRQTELRPPRPHRPGAMASLLRSVRTVRVTGTEERDGRGLVRLEPPPDTNLDARALGVVDPSVRNVSGRVEFLAEADGTPAVMDLEVRWDERVDSAWYGVTTDVEVAFSAIGQLVEISAPTRPWKPYVSRRLGYSIAYPENWGAYPGERSDEFRTARRMMGVTRLRAPKGATLDRLVANAIAFSRREYGARPETNEPVPLEEGEGRLLTYRVTLDETETHFTDRERYFMEAVIVEDNAAYHLVSWSFARNEVADRAEFEQFIGTFEILGPGGAAD